MDNIDNNNKKKKRTSPKASYYERFVNINREHPVLMNFLYVILAGIVLVWILLLFIDSWTRHGNESVVPPVKGQSIELARMTLDNGGFGCEVMDSVYGSAQAPGTVVDQNPREGSRVKPGRMVYLTVVAYSPKMVTVPDFMNVSMRQGCSMFEGLGLKVHVVTVTSEFKNLVLGAKVNGAPLRPGQRIPVSSNITLEVGGGLMPIDDEEDDNFVIADTGTDDNATYTDDTFSDPVDDEEATVQLLLQD